ncbi:MAG: Rieske (2Fe-2S) protein [Chloroflexi bacterium]|nr:Rieske (2Fe-2S) protein [Chloroflexota bacterium]
MKQNTSGQGVTRRHFLGYVTAALGAFVATVVAVPVVGAFVSPALKKKGSGQWISLGAIDKFTRKEPKMVGITVVKQDGWVEARQPRVVWVVAEDNNKFRVYNAQCTHLGCVADWDPQDRTWKSPCHGGVFAFEDGRVLAGPPPRGLDSLEYKIEGGELVVNYQDFRLGIEEKTAL